MAGAELLRFVWQFMPDSVKLLLQENLLRKLSWENLLCKLSWENLLRKLFWEEPAYLPLFDEGGSHGTYYLSY